MEDSVPTPPVGGGGQRRQAILASGEEPSCSCGTWYCCSKGIMEMQQFAESFYWSNPVLVGPPIPPVPAIQRPLTSGDEEEEISGGTTDDSVGKVEEEEEEISGGTTDDSVGKVVEEEEISGGTTDDSVGKVVEEEDEISGGTTDDTVGKVVEDEVTGGGDGGEKDKEMDQQRNTSIEFDDCFLYDELPPDLENMMDFIQDNSSELPPPLLDVEMNEMIDEMQLPVVQPEDEPYNLHDLDQVSSQPPSPIVQTITEPAPILIPAFVPPSTPPPKLTIQKLIKFVRNSPLYDQPNISKAAASTAHPLPPPSPSLPIIPVPEDSPPSANPPALEVNPSTPPSRRHSTRKKSFVVSEALITHGKERSVDENRPFFCKICEKSYATQTSFDIHLWRHRNCKGCRKQLKSGPVSSPSPMDYYCGTCATNLEKKSPPPSSSKRSSDKGDEDQDDGDDGDKGEDNGKDDNSLSELWCQICLKRFTYKRRFDAHMLIHKVDTSLNYNCKHCDNTYESKADLTAHLKSLEENKKFQCSVCDKWFRLKNHLESHMGSHKSDQGEFTCVICKKPFGSNRGLRAHQRSKSLCYYKMQRMENNQN